MNDTPQAVMRATAECVGAILSNARDGTFAIATGLINRLGEFEVKIEGLENRKFQLRCDQVESCQSLCALLLVNYPADVVEITIAIQQKLYQTWKSAIEDPANTSVCGRLVVEIEYQRGKQRYRVHFDTRHGSRQFFSEAI
jgi:hypothetical protein